MVSQRIAAQPGSDATMQPVRIDVWTWSLEGAVREAHALAENLSADEHDRAARFVFARDRAAFIVARARMRQILSRYLDRPAQSLRFGYGTYGKPHLEAPCLVPVFNLSHCGTIAALAVAWKCEVGIDVEQVKSIDTGLAQRYFSAAEVRALEQLPEVEQLQGFYRCWTRKEAVVKAVGSGLSLELASFDVSVGPEVEPRLLRFEGDTRASERWALRSFEGATGVIGALAVYGDHPRTPILEVRQLRLAHLA